MNTQAFLENILPFKLSESQSSVLQKMEDFDRILITGKRQTGVTTLLVLDLARLILSNNPGKYLFVCKNFHLHNNILNLVKLFFSDDSLKIDASRSINLPDGSKILLMTDSQLKVNTRGHTFDGIYVDDCLHLSNLAAICVLQHSKKHVFGCTSDNAYTNELIDIKSTILNYRDSLSTILHLDFNPLIG